MKNWLAITWSISNRFGWGVYGLNLALELLKRGKPTPICLDHISTETLPDDVNEKLRPLVAFREQNIAQMFRKGQVATLKDCLLLHAMGNGLDWGMISECFLGERNAGVIFFENTDFPPLYRERAKRLEMIVAGSTWNGEVLAAHNLTRIRTVLQGVNTEFFRPRPRTGQFGEKFVVFSGGKLDFRKGQDIVIAAFRQFQHRHDDVVLATAWHNLWPLTAVGFVDSPYMVDMPRVAVDNSLRITEWATDNGIMPDRFIDLGMVPNEEMPDLLRDMDLAVFPNRCEGGTNLVAMEAMACGIPCILSRNTGHLDLVDEQRCYILDRQKPVTIQGTGTEGWGESDVDELVELMENAYQNRNLARSKGAAAADFMSGLNWSNQIGQLLEVLDEVA